MFKCYNYIYLIFFFCIYSTLFSQQHRFEHYTTKDGLLSDEVYNLHQDKDGYIWIFTSYGPLKYNGKKFTPVLRNLPFEESIIYCIYENEQGRKWIANSNKNIYEVVRDSAFIVKGTENASKELKGNARDIYQIYIDSALNIYIKTFKSTIKLIKTNHYKPINLSEKEIKDSCVDHVMKFNETTYMGVFHDGFDIYHDNIIKHVKFMNGNDSNKDYTISFKGQFMIKYYKGFGQNIYFNIFNKIIKVKDTLITKEIFINEQILNFTKDQNNHLWVACYGNGLFELNEHDSIIHHYFKGKTINDVLVDSQNGLWVSTDGMGLYHCPNLNEYFYNENEVFGKTINFIKPIDHKLFIGSTNSNLYTLTKNDTIRIDKKNHQFNDIPNDIIKYKSSYLINYKLHLEELKGQSFRPHDLPVATQVFIPLKIIPFGKDSLLFLARNKIGILDKANLILQNKLSIKSITCNFKIISSAKRHHEVLIGTDKGVYCFKHDSLFVPPYLKELNNIKITNINKDAFNNYWLCTKGNGVFKLTPGNTIIHYSMLNGLPSNIINEVSSMEDNSLLLSTNIGLYYHLSKNTSLSLKNWKKLFDGEVQTAVPYQNNLYLGTKSGLVILDSTTLLKQNRLYFNLNSVYVNATLSNIHSLQNLSYKNNTLEFRFDMITYNNDVYPIIYKLSGESNDSGLVVSDKLAFNKLAPGTYTLTAKPMGKGIRYNGSFVTQFTIIPAFWQTTWFIVLCSVMVIALIASISWLFFRYVKKKEFKKNQANRILAEYSLVALKAQINPHFMSNCLSAIQDLNLHDKVDEANEYLAKFSFLVRQILNFSSQSFITLHEELKIIHLYVELEQLRFDHKFTFQLHLDPQIDADEFLIPSLLLQPFVENAIWHGLLPLKEKRPALLSLTISKTGNLLKIVIEDNGVGRKSGSHSKTNKESKGISITQKRIDNLKDIYNYTSAGLSYEDLTDDTDTPLGTRVIVILPDHLA